MNTEYGNQRRILKFNISVENSVLQQKIFDDLEGELPTNRISTSQSISIESTEITELTGVVRASGNYADFEMAGYA